MNKNKKSKLVLFSVLGLAAISIGTVGFATWAVGVQRKEASLTLTAVVDNTVNDSVILEATINSSKQFIVADKIEVNKNNDEIIGTSKGEGTVGYSPDALKFSFETLQYSVGRSVTSLPQKMIIELVEDIETNAKNYVAAEGNKIGTTFRTNDNAPWTYLKFKQEITLDSASYTVQNYDSYDTYVINTKDYVMSFGSFFNNKNSICEYYNGLSYSALTASDIFKLTNNIKAELDTMKTVLSSGSLTVKVTIQ
ncbi:MAG: hypothetical protein PUG89_10500 [Succinivibrio sp.]|nr:hypothetical protein [Succinivibrio sp.]